MYWLVIVSLSVVIGAPMGLLLHMLMAAAFGWTYDRETGEWQ